MSRKRDLCLHQGKVYSATEFGLNVEVPSAHPGVTAPCPNQPYVRQIFKDYIFLADDRILKCHQSWRSAPSGFVPPGQSVPISMQEGRNYELIGEHPNFLKYYGQYRSPGTECLVLEYLPRAVPFTDLTEVSSQRLLDIVRQSFTALDYLHSLGIQHGDIHGGNLLWDPDKNRVVLIDLESLPLSSSKDVRWDRYDLVHAILKILDPISIDKRVGVRIDEARSKYTDPVMQEAINLMSDRIDHYEIPISFSQAGELIQRGQIQSYRVDPQLQGGVPPGLTRVILVGKHFLEYELITGYDPATAQIFPS